MAHDKLLRFFFIAFSSLEHVVELGHLLGLLGLDGGLLVGHQLGGVLAQHENGALVERNAVSLWEARV